jgi:hypothetical protein
MSDLVNSSPITCRRNGEPTRTRVTEVAEIIEATGIDAITNDGQRVALHFATRRGIITVRAPLKSFIEKARAPLDSNNRPFSLRAPNREIYSADAKQVPITKGAPSDSCKPPGSNRYGRQGLPTQLVSQLRRAYFDHARGLESKAVAQELGLHAATVAKYFAHFAVDLAAAEAPIPKPNGKLL